MYPSEVINSRSGTVIANDFDTVPSGRHSNIAMPHCSGGVGVLCCHSNCALSQFLSVRPGSLPSQLGHSLFPECWEKSWAITLKLCCCLIHCLDRMFSRVCVKRKFAVRPVTDFSASGAPFPEKGPGASRAPVPANAASASAAAAFAIACAPVHLS